MAITRPNMSHKRPAFQPKAMPVLCVLSALLLTSLVAAQRNELANDEATVASNIKALRSENSNLRATAARTLRQIVAKYPSGNTNIRSKDGGKAFWTEKVNRIVPGMLKEEVARLLPLFTEAPEQSSLGTGQSHYVSYRVDNDWIVRISYYNPDKVIERPKLISSELAIFVVPPDRYTGTWICWHVNGQKSYEIQFTDGKYDGVFTKFYDNGHKAFEQHYVAHEANGTDTGWYPDGKIMYTGQYKNGKQDGPWMHLYPDGKKSSESNYREGARNGLYAAWYENGQMRFEMSYKNGVQHGISAAWSEQGVLQYRREYNNGKVIE